MWGGVALSGAALLRHPGRWGSIFIGAAAPKNVGKIVIVEVVRRSVTVHDEDAALTHGGQIVAAADLCKCIGADDPAFPVVVGDPVNQIVVSGKDPLNLCPGDVQTERAGVRLTLAALAFGVEPASRAADSASAAAVVVIFFFMAVSPFGLWVCVRMISRLLSG